jgi:hypothetical protein
MIDLRKCKFSKAQIRDAKKYGIKVELEHTTSRKKAYKIALQHECEFPLYYIRGLIPMEKRLSKKYK